jgi:hypothetical protein
MFPNKEVLNELKKNPLYIKAFQAFQLNDHKTGMELLNQLQSTEHMKKIKDFYEKNDENINKELLKAGIINIDKDDPIPKGYNRNTFTKKTCITSQQKDLPEWENITAIVLYDEKVVYEDHYILRFTTENALFDLQKKYTKPFIGKIITDANVKNTMDKFKKNSLYLIIETLNIELYVSYSVLNIFKELIDIKTLKNINVIHKDKIYNEEEKKLIKRFFIKSKWHNLNIQDQFEFSSI